jgi:2-amino-4-hydroxy-6-hydroxymethyldihydropteridine diphosphokinase
MSRHWLLVLGSNLADDACLRQALVALEALGGVVQLTPVLLTPARRGEGHYHNALVALASDAHPAALRQALKRVETALGRVRDGSGVVAIDIDPLAFDEGHGWQPDAHALEKGEFVRAPVPQLLSQAGIVLAGVNSGSGTG